jgi:hypothetical protein
MIIYDKKLVTKYDTFMEMLIDSSLQIEMVGIGGCKKFDLKDYPTIYIYGIAFGKGLIDSTEAVLIYLQVHDKTLKEQKKAIKQYIKLRKD